MVRGLSNHKNQLVNNNISPRKPKQRRKSRPNLSHSNSSRRTSPLKSESLSSTHSLDSSRLQASPVAHNTITKYYDIQKSEKKSSAKKHMSTSERNNSNEELENYVLKNCRRNILQEFNDRLGNNHFEEKNFVNGKETNKTESCVPLSPSTALSGLRLNEIKNVCEVGKCLTSHTVLKANTQKLNSKILKDSGNSTNPQTKLTEFFPVRRSVRKTEKTVLEEKRKTLEEAIRSNKEDGLKVRIFEGKGRGVVAARKFHKGEFVVEYAGELIRMEEAQKREASYSRDENIGCYMYYFKHRNEQYCIDATAETNRLGRLLNHSRFGNLCTKTVDVQGKPRLVLIAKEDIEPGCELTYDYGDRSKLSLQYHPWLAQ